QIKLIIVGKEKELTFTDNKGEAVTVNKPITRIVAMYNEQVDLLRALHAADKIVGIPERIRKEEAYYPVISKLPSIGSVHGPDYEAILSLNPDVLMVYFPGWIDCEKLPGITCIFLGHDGLSPEDFTRTVTTFGYIFNKEDEAEKYINWNIGWINEIKSRTSGLSEEEKPRVFRWWWSSKGGYGHGTCNEKDVIAGGKNIAEELPIRVPGGIIIDPEWVADQSIDIIVAHAPASICGHGFDDVSEMAAAREDIMNYAELGNTNAVKKGDVYLIDNRHFMCVKAGYAISVAYLAKWFHPKLFEDLDPKAIHQDYITRLQRVDYDLDKHGVFVYHPEKHPEGK
ncbi:MAG: ABC transporter substrate-binding protein, partial [Methanophagales archaeon]|nr:ABC transporter substrate-binding protein [Methanophagales archaeon]